jgi:hypothetical protein
MPDSRPLKIYAFDPSRGRELSNYMTVNARYEKVKPGPVGDYIAVIDYDASNRKYYEPVDLDSPAVMLGGGLEPSESDPRFHQQMVYAVMMETIRRFESALGRKVKWAPDRGPKTDPHHGKLHILPHGIEEANAYYDPELRAIVFGYFAAGEEDVGANLPGQTVFTCLSHDIIVHETTHALIDGLRQKFTTATGPDTPAFHEAFADIVALFQHFSYKDALLDAIQRTGGYLHRSQLQADARPEGEAQIRAEAARPNPLVELARQFGDAMGLRAALRSALDKKPDPRLLETALEPHERGAILVAAVFDAFFSVYLRRTRDLMRIGRAGGAVGAQGDLHPDLVNQLAGQASKLAQHFSTICIRALDYCPPVDITFGEFLRAIVTADSDLVPEDPWGYRPAFIEAFRARGIVPEDVGSYSEEALRWRPPDAVDPKRPLKRCTGLTFNVMGEPNPRQTYRNATILHGWASANPEPLGLSGKPKFQVFSFHPLHRVGPDGQLCFDFVVEFLQERQERVDASDPQSQEFTYLGGSTVILNQHGEVRYAIIKRIDSQRRLARQRAFLGRAGVRSALAPYIQGGGGRDMGFAAIHRGF